MIAGDKFIVKKVAPHFEEDYSVGDVYEFHKYFDKDEDIIIATNGLEFYDWEIEPYVEPPKDYAEDLETSLTQAIEGASWSAIEPPDFPTWGGGAHGIHTPGKRSPNDVVSAPSHYVNSGIEPIEYMADKLPAYDDGFTAFCVGNVLKYVSRAPHKGNLLQDLKKARQYLDFAIEHEEKKQN